jgi:hypothetical protein
MKNRKILFVALFAVTAAIAAIVAGPGAVNAVIDGAIQWFNYFVHVHFEY